MADSSSVIVPDPGYKLIPLAIFSLLACQHRAAEVCQQAEVLMQARGMEQGMDRLGTLVGLLLDAGRLDDARRVSEDAAYRDEMLAEFGLKVSE